MPRTVQLFVQLFARRYSMDWKFYVKGSKTKMVGRLICSNEFSVLYLRVNFTRFYIVTGNRDLVLPNHEPCQDRALLRLSTMTTTRAAELNGSPISSLAISRLLLVLNMTVIRIDRRPKVNTTAFEDVYFIELQKPPVSSVTVGTNRGNPWLSELEEAIARVRNVGGDAVLLGVW